MDSGFIDILSPQAIADMKLANAELVTMIKNVKTANENMIGAKTPSQSDGAIKQLNKDYEAQEKVIKKLQLQLIALAEAQRKVKLEGQGFTKNLAEQAVNQRALALAADRQAKSTSALAGAYANLSAKQALSKKSLQDLIVAGRQADQTQGQYNAKLKAAQSEFDKLNTKVLSADKAVGVFSRNVGNYPKITSGLTSLMSAFGLVGGVYLFASAIKHAFTEMREFEKANADLAAFMGKTRAEISDLTNEQMRLAVVTRYSATEIAGVQKELAKSGFNNTQIKEATLSVLNFASAIGVDLEQSVMVTDTVLKTFGLSTKETTRVNDVMAKSFSSSRLRIEDFKESIKYVAPIASSLHIPFEKVTALLSVLADNGIKGSMAGTSLRRILTELTKTGGDFNTAYAKLVKNGISVKDAFDEVGRTAQTTLLILGKHKDQVNELEKAYEKAAGTADEMAQKQLDTLDGKIHILTSSWDVFLISLSKGDGVLSKASKWFIDLTTETINWYTALNNASSSYKAIFEKSSDEGYTQQFKAITDEAEKSGVAVEKLASVRQAMAIKNRDSTAWEISGLKDYQKEQEKIALANKGNILTGNNQTGVAAIKNMDVADKKIKQLAKTYGYWNGVIIATNELIRGNKEALVDTAEKEAELTEKQKAARLKAEKNERDVIEGVLDARIRFLKQLSQTTQEEYNLQKQVRESEISDLDKLAKDEKRSYEERITSYGEMLQKKQELILFSQTFELAQLKKKHNEDEEESKKAEHAELKKAGTNAEAVLKIKSYYHSELILMDQEYEAKKGSINEKASQDYLNLAEETAKAEIEIDKKRREVLASTDKTYRDEQIDIFKRASDNEKLSIEIRQSNFQAYIDLKRKELEIDKIVAIAKAGNNKEERADVEATFEVANRHLNVEAADDPFAKSLEKSNEALKALKKTLTSGFFSEAGLGSLTQLFDGTFKEIMAGFDKSGTKAEQFAKKAAYSFMVVSEIAQEAFNFINEASQKNFDKEYSRLETQKNIAIQFAGDSATAKAEIDKEYEERKRAIANREAKAKKKLAIFNAIIDTAQAVVSALPNYYLAAAVAILGAAEIALISSQQVPQYWRGTDNAYAGWAQVDEKGAEIHADKHGNIKSTGSTKGANLRYLEQGDKIITAEKSKAMMFNAELNGLLSSNNINTPIIVNNSGMTDAQVDRIISGMAANKSGGITIIEDERGRRIHANNQSSRAMSMNNRYSVKG